MNKVNTRRLTDLENFSKSNEALDKIDNGIYDFLNRESNKQVINPVANNDDDYGKRLIVSEDILKNYQEVHLKDYISPL